MKTPTLFPDLMPSVARPDYMPSVQYVGMSTGGSENVLVFHIENVTGLMMGRSA